MPRVERPEDTPALYKYSCTYNTGWKCSPEFCEMYDRILKSELTAGEKMLAELSLCNICKSTAVSVAIYALRKSLR